MCIRDSAGTFPFFIFDQTNALFIGSDLDIRYRHSEHLNSELKISYVSAREIENDQRFIEIPPLNVSYSLEYGTGPLNFGLNLNYTAEQFQSPRTIEPGSFQNGGPSEFNQDEIFDFMDAPDDFFLIGGKINYKYNSFNVELGVDNLLNTTYRSNTDRLRYFADAPGRNVSLTLQFEF